MNENMKNFLEKTNNDEALLGKLKECKSHEDIIALAKEQGFEITVDDIKALKEALEAAKNGELSDDDLENVNGGVIGLIAAGVTALYLIGTGCGWFDFD